MIKVTMRNVGTNNLKCSLLLDLKLAWLFVRSMRFLYTQKYVKICSNDQYHIYNIPNEVWYE